MRYFLAIFAIIVVATVGILGFRGSHFRKPPLRIFPDMEFQLKLQPQKDFGGFGNPFSSQVPVPGTVARAQVIQGSGGSALPFEDLPVVTGRETGKTNFIEHMPVAVNALLLERGRQRYTINCAPCHGAIADGNGMPRKIGAMAVVANLHDRRIVEMPDGELFHVISNGRNLMGAYSERITVEDRWAVIAYVRALQLARLGTPDDVPAEARDILKK